MDVAKIAEQLPITGKLGEFEYRTCDPVLGENTPITAVVWRRSENAPWQLPSAAGKDFVDSVISDSKVQAPPGLVFATDARQLSLISKRLQEGMRTR